MKKEKCSKFGTISRILINSVLNDPMKWLYWFDILEAHVKGFGNLSKRTQIDEIKSYRARLSDTRKDLNEKGYFLLASGAAMKRRLKIATDHPDDIAFANSMIEHSKRLTEDEKSRQKLRIAIMANEKQLPPHARL